MRFSQALLALAGTATAIDINLHQGGNCDASLVLSCRGINPNTCCGRSAGIGSVAFVYIPTDWNLGLRGHGGGFCAYEQQIGYARNTNFACLRSGPFTGGGYWFNGKKRGLEPVDAAYKDPKNCQKPDVLIIEDGTEFNIANMDESTLNEFIDVAKSGLNATAVPEKFLQYEKK